MTTRIRKITCKILPSLLVSLLTLFSLATFPVKSCLASSDALIDDQDKIQVIRVNKNSSENITSQSKLDDKEIDRIKRHLNNEIDWSTTKDFKWFIGLGATATDKTYIDFVGGLRGSLTLPYFYDSGVISHISLADLGMNVSKSASDSRYRTEHLSNGNTICRDTTNGQFAKKENCEDGYDFNTFFASSADISVKLSITYFGVGYRVFNEKGMYYTAGIDGKIGSLKAIFNKDIFAGLLLFYF